MVGALPRDRPAPTDAGSSGRRKAREPVRPNRGSLRLGGIMVSMAGHGRRLMRAGAERLAVGTELLYLDMAGTSSGLGTTLRRVKVKRYERVGSVRLLVVELEDGSERSPSINSLF